MKSHDRRIPCILLCSAAAILGLTAIAHSAPIALTDSYRVLKNRQKYIDLRGFYESSGTVTDPDTFTWTILTCPGSGTLKRMDGTSISCSGNPNGTTIVYVPNNNFTGTDSFTFRFSVSGVGNSNTAAISLVVSTTYTAPFGIDAPAFGIEDNAPNDYYSCYVDPDDEDSTDEDNPCGTETTPRKTIPTSLDAGDVVEVHGTGPEAAPLIIDAPGTVEDPIYIRGESAAVRGVLRSSIQIQGDYVIFENIDFDCSTPEFDPPCGPTYQGIWFSVREQYVSSGTWLGHESVCIRHCSFSGHPADDQTGGVAAILFGATHCSWCNNPSCNEPPSYNTNGSLVKNCVIYDTLVKDFGDWTTNGTQDYGGCAFEGNTNEMWCLDSVVHHMQGNGIGMSRNNALSEQVSARNCYIGRNVIHHTKEYPVGVKFVEGGIISQNKIYRVRASDSSRGGGVGITNNDHVDASPYTDRLWIIFNHIYDTHYGVFASHNDLHCTDGETAFGDARVYVVGNIFHHVLPHGAAYPDNFGAAVAQGPQFQIRTVNNTIYKCTQGLRVGCLDAGALCPAGCPSSCSTAPCSCPSDEEYPFWNTESAFINNIVLETVIDPDSSVVEAHARVCQSNYDFLLSWFDYNLHYGNTLFILPDVSPNPTCVLTTSCTYSLRGMTDYGDHSLEDHPRLCNPPKLDFLLNWCSPVATAGVYDDDTYDVFEDHFPSNPSIKHDYNGTNYTNNLYPIGAFKTQSVGNCLACPFD